jgi:hypothetical protein
MFEKLDDTNFMLFAARNYDNPECLETVEFYDDLKRFKYVKRLLNKYRESGEFKERLILNHMMVILNIFGDDAAIRMMFFKLYDYRDELFTILEFLGRMPTKISGITHLNITIDKNDLNSIDDIVKTLRKI